LEAARSTGQWDKSAERQVLKAAVGFTLSRCRGNSDKRRQRKLPQEVQGDSSLVSCPDPASITDIIDMTIDLAEMSAGWTPLQREVWRLCTEGFTVREIGDRVGLSFQRVAEMRQKLVQAIGQRLRQYRPGG
jgi:DNA-directed RNA polymerase specialized sigma24 family protein